MKIRRSTSLIGVVAIAALALAGCSQSGGGSSPASTAEGSASADGGGAQKTIALVVKSSASTYWKAVQNGAEKKAQELGYKLVVDGPATETETDKQLTIIDTAINNKPAAIGIAPLDPQACADSYSKAKDASIPVIEFDSKCNSDVAVATARTDSLVAGALAADKMAALMQEKGEVAIVTHSQTASTAIDRTKGFTDQMAKKYPNIKVLPPQDSQSDQTKAADIAKTFYQANPNLTGIYATNEDSAIGTVNGLSELNVDPSKLVVIGFDSGKAQIDAIKSGAMDGAITQDPVSMGSITVELADKAIKGEKIDPNVIDTGSKYYDKSNIDSPEIAALLYQ